jgi:hypothetical protein
VAAVAPANKIVRMVWAIIVSEIEPKLAVGTTHRQIDGNSIGERSADTP